jgi:hypothetical protein
MEKASETNSHAEDLPSSYFVMIVGEFALDPQDLAVDPRFLIKDYGI